MYFSVQNTTAQNYLNIWFIPMKMKCSHLRSVLIRLDLIIHRNSTRDSTVYLKQIKSKLWSDSTQHLHQYRFTVQTEVCFLLCFTSCANVDYILPKANGKLPCVIRICTHCYKVPLETDHIFRRYSKFGEDNSANLLTALNVSLSMLSAYSKVIKPVTWKAFVVYFSLFVL